jgi:hypothetical protein
MLLVSVSTSRPQPRKKGESASRIGNLDDAEADLNPLLQQTGIGLPKVSIERWNLWREQSRAYCVRESSSGTTGDGRLSLRRINQAYRSYCEPT